jgi:hypothetical protein
LGISKKTKGTGPYRQILTDIIHELHVPNLVPEALFIPNTNATDDANIHTIVPNPSSGSSQGELVVHRHDVFDDCIFRTIVGMIVFAQSFSHIFDSTNYWHDCFFLHNQCCF